MKIRLLLLILCINTSFLFANETDVLVHRLHEDLNRLLKVDPVVEVIGEGFNWSEGPVWVSSLDCLLFSDVPENIMYQWKRGEGVRKFLEPSGYTGLSRKHYKQGSNGLAVSADGKLLICEGGDRRLSMLDFNEGKRRVIADNYKGARFNSPNDLVIARNGDIYMTDPVWGLQGHADDPYREMDYQGIFLIRKSGEIVLLDSEHEFPNGIALSPEEDFLYECQFNEWYRYPVLADGTVGEKELFYSAKAFKEQGLKGSADGMAMDAEGNLWATGPGGVLILSPEGVLLGRIETGVSIGNCCFGEDGSTLFVTSDGTIYRIETQTKGVGF